MNGGEYSYVGDYKFILFKVMIVISTIAMGFIITMTSPAYYMGPWDFVHDLDMTKNVVVTTFLIYMSSIWLTLAVALLPFGHTVYTGNTNNIDMERTTQLNAVQRAVYSGPYHILMILMSFGLMVLVGMMLMRMVFAAYNPTNPNSPLSSLFFQTFGSVGVGYSRLMNSMHATFGCYFTVGSTPEEWKAIATDFKLPLSNSSQ